MIFRFQNRSEAGRLLANKLKHYEGRSDVVVLALPRGGVPVAYEVAERLKAPLDVFLVRKLGVPGHAEFAMGAIASGEVCFLNENIIASLRIPRSTVDRVIAREKEELIRRELAYRQHDQVIEMRNRVVILIDDGLATGASMRAAVMAVKERHPARVVVAVPVAAASMCEEFQREVDEMICLQTPEPFFAVGEWYEDFSQASDEEVRTLLERATKFQQVIPAHSF